MSEYLRSAFNNLSSNWGSPSNDESTPHQREDNPFVGETIDLKGHRLKVERVIAEGEYSFKAE